MRPFLLGDGLLVALVPLARAEAPHVGRGGTTGPYHGHEIHARWQRSSCGSPVFQGIAPSVVVQRDEDSCALAAHGGASHCRSGAGWDGYGWGLPPVVIDVEARRPRGR